jgi:hypothetical protein
MPEAELPKCFDPYLRYAISRNFENFVFLDDKKPKPGNAEKSRTPKKSKKSKKSEKPEPIPDRKLVLLVELIDAGLRGAFEYEMINDHKVGADFGPDVGQTRYLTLRAGKQAVSPPLFDVWNKYVSRVELSLPVKPAVKEFAFTGKRTIFDRHDQLKYPPGPLLIGVLDDGCPFASVRFLKSLPSGVVSTRVRGIWDQNQGKPQVQINGRDFGQVPSDFGYGQEYWRDFKPSSTVLPIGLDEWMALHKTAYGSIDEDHCYADASFNTLAFRDSHGAHVMDVLAGRLPVSSSLGPFASGDRRDPPSWAPGTDPASSADIVFVQFSQECIDDSTGVWLKDFVVEGIQYILSYADPANTKRVVINLSYGPTTGPHDGTAELESALRALVMEYDGSPGKPKLEIALAGGNSYLTDGHVAFAATKLADIEWIWRLPPDNSVLCFAEVWMKTADVGAATTVTLTSPSGKTYIPTAPPTVPPPPPLPQAGVDAPIDWGDNTMWRLQVEPTIIAPNVDAAEHGDYTITVSGIPAGAEVHAYVARSDPNMDVISGSRLSHFVDPRWELTQSAEAGCEYADGEFDDTGSLIHRDGTLNGIATDDYASVHVAGGYIISNGRKSSYASAGPARSGPLTLRVGPDFVLPCDESCALEGIRAGGNRSGAVFRLIGTSTAAPQLAREVASPPLPAPTNIPTSNSEIEKRGGGDLKPP